MNLWGRVFARLYDRTIAASEAAGLADMRATLLAQATGTTLEIGAGTGLNLDRYPRDVVDLTLCEPEEPMARVLRGRAAARGAAVRIAPAERLPAADASVDTVVSTLVLCTVDDPAVAVAEVVRVLKPGGRLLFLEHVRADDPAAAHRQDRWDPVWRRFGHGCRCNRDTLTTLRSGGLDVTALEHTRLPKAAPIVRPTIVGVAVRPPVT
jgi:SAM-dependent methyltransferase